MRRANPSGSLVTWGLALALTIGIDAAVTRSALLWGPTAFEYDRARGLVFGQTFRVARKIYWLRSNADHRIAILGSSLIGMATRENNLERDLRRIAPSLDTRVDQLAIFGASPASSEIVSRHLPRLDPNLVIVTVSGTDLFLPPVATQGPHPARLLRIGWKDGPIPPPDWKARIDRWLRTLWPLYRFREFARAAIEDRVLSPPRPRPHPEQYASAADVFEWMHPEISGRVAAAHRAWLADPTLERFEAYLEVGDSAKLKRLRQRVSRGPDRAHESLNLIALETLLDRLRRDSRSALVLMPPENPLLALDTRGSYHWPDISEPSARAIAAAAARHGFRFVDARRWMPAEAFLDFYHLMPDLSGFEARLAREILREIES